MLVGILKEFYTQEEKMRITKDRLRTLIREELTRTLSEDAHRAVTMSSTDPYEYIKIDDVWHTREKGGQGDWTSLAGNEEAIARLEGERGSSPRPSQNALRRIRRAVVDRLPYIMQEQGGDQVDVFGPHTPIRLVLTVGQLGEAVVDDSSRIYPEATSGSEDHLRSRLAAKIEKFLSNRDDYTLRFQNSEGVFLTGDAAMEAFEAELAANQPVVIERAMSFVDRPDDLLAQVQMSDDYIHNMTAKPGEERVNPGLDPRFQLKLPPSED